MVTTVEQIRLCHRDFRRFPRQSAAPCPWNFGRYNLARTTVATFLSSTVGTVAFLLTSSPLWQIFFSQ